jgi:hypothetical protein
MSVFYHIGERKRNPVYAFKTAAAPIAAASGQAAPVRRGLVRSGVGATFLRPSSCDKPHLSDW